MPTSIEELERVHLRFIRVTDDIKLTEILAKILPNMINVFLEDDLTNADLENPKIKAIEQILGHLIMRVKNSQKVNPPWVSLLDIFNQQQYLNFENQLVKRHVADRILGFIFESYSRIPSELDQQLLHVLLQSLESNDLKYLDKCRLYLLLIQRISQYAKSAQLEKVGSMLQPIFTPELKNSFLQMSVYYLMSNIHNLSIQNSLRESFDTSIVQMTSLFRQDLKETPTQFIQNYDDTILKVTGIQCLFTAEDIIHLHMVATLSNINKTRDYAENSVRNLIAQVDTKDHKISENIFKMVFTELYFYKDFSEREDQQIQTIPPNMQIKLIEYLIRFESSATQHPLNQKLIFHCFFSVFNTLLTKIGLDFVKHMIRFNDITTDERTVQFLKNILQRILEEPSFGEENQSQALLLLGDMALRNYHAIDDDIEIAINTFQKLKLRIQQLEADHFVAIRNDFIANNYIESLNRMRDCYESKLVDNNKRGIIVSFVLNQLNKEGNVAHQEIVYLLFLYLTRLDQGQFNSSVLLHSIILKDHQDIKIKKEAQFQLDKFHSSQGQEKRILRPFLKDIQIFLQRHNLDSYIYDGSEYQLEELLTFNSVHYNQDFIDKLLEINQFTLKFFKEEVNQKENLMDLEDMQEVQEIIERLQLMNLNQNFQMIKADFSNPLTMIFDYLKIATPVGCLRTIGVNFVYKLSLDSVNLAQRVLSLKILIKILKSVGGVTQDNREFFIKLSNSLPQLDKLEMLTHENKLNTLYNLTFQNLFQSSEHHHQLLNTLIQLITGQQGLSPNAMEQIKFLCVCLKKLGQAINLNEQVLANQNLAKLLDYLHTYVTRNELDPVFRKYLLQNFAGILKSVKPTTILIERADALLKAFIEYDNYDVQEQVGRALARMHKYASDEELGSYCQKMVEKVFSKVEQSSLIVKRNVAIFVNAIIELYGQKHLCIQNQFLSAQRVFLKFLFDRKPQMQDLSSKALSKIYHLGTPEVRTLLVDALSKTLSGEKSAATDLQEKDENVELLLEFKDNTSSEQREKLKTYKDLCNIAVELGHRELIYQFLEVHRHLAHYQDIKNAAKGLSSIIMLDERLQKDLMKIAPKILLLSYDHNDEVKETMKELWSSLIEVEKEEQVINQRWDEIFKEAMDGLNSKEYRRRQSSALALSDLLHQRTWSQISKQFKDLFLTSLGLLDDQKDSVKLAAYQLIKTLKRVTLKLGNIYTNSKVDELEEILGIVIPMILDEGIKSNMQAVKFFSVDLLFEIVKTSQHNEVMKQLKVQNKYERQLVFNYNSDQKMREILNKWLDRIILEVIANLSQMNKAVEQINYFEQLAIEHGLSGSSSKSKMGISEGELNDMRLKYTKDSAWGEILKICRDQLTEPTFTKILNDLIGFMIKGHDQITKSTAVSFVQDIILENKFDLITPQNSRKISQKLIEIYSLNSVQAALSIKESMQALYAQLIGLNMKILKEFPKTVGQLFDTLMTLPRELDIIKILNVYEICKNLPDDLLRKENYLAQAYPIIFINRFQANDHRIKTLSRKAHSHICDHVPQIVEHSREEIFKLVLVWLESAQYDDRVAASNAMQEISNKLSEEDFRGSTVANEVIDKMHQLIAGKYFNNKETVIEGFMTLIKISNQIRQTDFINKFVGETCYIQIEKSIKNRLGYKNAVNKALNQCLEVSHKLIKSQIKAQYFEIFAGDIKYSLKKVSEKAAMIESMDEFEEKRVEEKDTLQSALLTLESYPFIIETTDQLEFLNQLCSTYYHITNWLVRNGILKCYLQLLKFNQFDTPVVNFVTYLLQNVADVGEKYDTNLTIISDVAMLFSEQIYKRADISEEIKVQNRINISKIVELLIERGTEDLKKNVDLIKRNINA